MSENTTMRSQIQITRMKKPNIVPKRSARGYV